MPISHPDDAIDQAVLSLLVEPGNRQVWALDDLAREIGDPREAADAVARLAGAGLVHVSGGLILASRAAVRAAQLA